MLFIWCATTKRGTKVGKRKIKKGRKKLNEIACVVIVVSAALQCLLFCICAICILSDFVIVFRRRKITGSSDRFVVSVCCERRQHKAMSSGDCRFNLLLRAACIRNMRTRFAAFCVFISLGLEFIVSLCKNIHNGRWPLLIVCVWLCVAHIFIEINNESVLQS